MKNRIYAAPAVKGLIKWVNVETLKIVGWHIYCLRFASGIFITGLFRRLRLTHTPWKETQYIETMLG